MTVQSDVIALDVNEVVPVPPQVPVHAAQPEFPLAVQVYEAVCPDTMT